MRRAGPRVDRSLVIPIDILNLYITFNLFVCVFVCVFARALVAGVGPVRLLRYSVHAVAQELILEI